MEWQAAGRVPDRRSGMPSPDEQVGRVTSRYQELLDSADPHEWAAAWRTEINRGGFLAVDFLMESVVEAGKCVGCAACVTICPVDVFDYRDEKPVTSRRAACVRCVLCVDVCSVLRPPDKGMVGWLDPLEPSHDQGFGLYGYGVYARATDPHILARGQDGGFVSALLVHLIETGEVAGAVLGSTCPDNRQIGRHELATSRAAVLACAGSRYTFSPNTLALKDAMRRDVRPLAVVGVPCQVDGVRLEQHSGIKIEMADWYRANVRLTIGLFCSESFTHESLVKLGEMLDVDPSRIDNINIKGKVVVRLDGGEIRTASLRKYREFARPACLYCRDYSAEQADLAAGGVGIDGWTLVLVRTKAGQRAFTAAIAAGVVETRPLDDEPRGERLLVKMAEEKRRNRPHPALMPGLAEREASGHLDPKTYYTSGPGAQP